MKTVEQNIGYSFKNKNILIIDDIYTTGATVSSSSKVLLESGASKVFFITVATGMGI